MQRFLSDHVVFVYLLYIVIYIKSQLYKERESPLYQDTHSFDIHIHIPNHF